MKITLSEVKTEWVRPSTTRRKTQGNAVLSIRRRRGRPAQEQRTPLSPELMQKRRILLGNNALSIYGACHVLALLYYRGLLSPQEYEGGQYFETKVLEWEGYHKQKMAKTAFSNPLLGIKVHASSSSYAARKCHERNWNSLFSLKAYVITHSGDEGWHLLETVLRDYCVPKDLWSSCGIKKEQILLKKALRCVYAYFLSFTKQEARP